MSPLPVPGRPTAELDAKTDRQILHILSLVGWLEDGTPPPLPPLPVIPGVGGLVGKGLRVSSPGRGLWAPSGLGRQGRSTRESLPPMRGVRVRAGLGGGGVANHDQYCDFLNNIVFFLLLFVCIFWFFPSFLSFS